MIKANEIGSKLTLNTEMKLFYFHQQLDYIDKALSHGLGIMQ
jgi:hypothetical protein